VIEAYDSIKYLLLEIIKHNTEEHSIVTALFNDIDVCIHSEKFTKAYKMTLLPRIHEKLVSLIELLLRPEPDLRDMVNVLQALYEVSVREFPRVKKRTEQLHFR